MAAYLVGDIQGCASELNRLLALIDFSPSKDTLYPLGDLVNRGPQSTTVLRTLMALGSSVRPVLGNHDLHLLALAAGLYKPAPDDTAGAVLKAPDKDALLAWLRMQPLARYEHGVLMLHAGVLPHWDCKETLVWADRLQTLLQAPDWNQQLKALWGNHPNRWKPGLSPAQTLRLALNALTRLRFCSTDGRIDFTNNSDTAHKGTLAWFDIPRRKSINTPIAFGHWSTLGLMLRSNLAGLDTGCVWGGQLSALRLPSTTSAPCDLRTGEVFQIPATA